MNKIELLAPAKDLHKAKTAIRYGADAVFIGGKQYSLRSRASNFNEEDMQEAVNFAHAYGRKLYVTVNIVFHDEDLIGIKEYLQKLEKMGVDAVIIESLALIEIGKKIAPKLEYHVSTQLSSLNSAAANFLAYLGADRVVLGRETSMEEIEKIALKTKVPLEVFIHGGMCANVSGRCTLSNHLTLRDANRGGCAQSCRWHYHLYDKNRNELSDEENLFSMGSKDLVAVRHIERMAKAGVASLKIEGRMKSDYYIATVVKTYRSLLDELALSEHLSEERLLYYEQEMTKAENRPAACGFLDGKMDETKQLYHEEESVRHDYVAYVLAYDSLTSLASITSRNPFQKGDLLEVFGPFTNNKQFIVEDIYDENDNLILVSNKPMKQLKIKIPFMVEEHAMIRWVKNVNSR